MAELFPTINSISDKKEYLMRDAVDKKEYNPWMVNRGLSNFMDTVMFANEINKYYSLEKDMQYDFLFYGVPKGKRFSKWAKQSIDADVKLIMKAYDVNRTRAQEYLKLISPEQLQDIHAAMNPGGKSK